jgi:hypothetical protein
MRQGQAMSEPTTTGRLSDREVPVALDAALGLAGVAVEAVVTTGRAIQSVSRPVATVVRRGSTFALARRPGAWLDAIARSGAVRRDVVEHEVARLLDVVVPVVAVAVLRRLDLARLVQEYVDIEGIVGQVDLNAVAERLDVDAVAQRLDLDAVVGRLDLDAVVALVDIDAVARRLDLDGLVATVDLDAAAARLDVDAVIDRVDLVGLAQTVMAGIDLPEIIRESTGVVASDTVREVRMQSISGDDAVARVVDRLLLRHHRRADGQASSAEEAPLAEESVLASTRKPGTEVRPG